MKISSADCFDYNLPFVSTISLGGSTFGHREGVLIRLSDECGNAGWGEAAPLPDYSRESLSEARNQLLQIAAELPQTECDIPLSFNDEAYFPCGNVMSCPSVRLAVESAMAELWSSANDKSIAELFNLAPRDSVLVNGLLTGEDKLVLSQAALIAKRNFPVLKIKIGDRFPDKAADLLDRLYDMLPSSPALRLDVNRQWDIKLFSRFSDSIENREYRKRIEYVEEPASSDTDLRASIKAGALPIALDETLAGIEPEQLHDYDGAAAVILKPTVLGGLRRTFRFARAANSLGMKAVLGSSFESDLATLTLARFSSVVCDEQTACGFDTLKWFANGLLESPPVIVDGHINLSESPNRNLRVKKSFIREIHHE